MKISERTVTRLGEIITGDKGISPYRGGPKLVSFFNECGTNHIYSQGFPSRWMFAEDSAHSWRTKAALYKRKPSPRRTSFLYNVCPTEYRKVCMVTNRGCSLMCHPGRFDFNFNFEQNLRVLLSSAPISDSIPTGFLRT
jgi:hypothetical protein